MGTLHNGGVFRMQMPQTPIVGLVPNEVAAIDSAAAFITPSCDALLMRTTRIPVASNGAHGCPNRVAPFPQSGCRSAPTELPFGFDFRIRMRRMRVRKEIQKALKKAAYVMMDRDEHKRPSPHACFACDVSPRRTRDLCRRQLRWGNSFNYTDGAVVMKPTWCRAATRLGTPANWGRQRI
jgi:hypothetical protein